MNRIVQADLDHILRHTPKLWEELRQGRIFIAGGTGFFGKWLVESFLAANDSLALDASITVLSRKPEDFAKKSPHIAAHPALRIVKGDVRDFTFPEGNFTHLIHGAVDANLKIIQEQPLLIFDTLVQGTKRILEFVKARGVKKMLLISSGAVYGRQPSNIHLLPEEYRGAPDLTDRYAVYGEALRAAELLCRPAAAIGAFQAKIARCFSFVGPHLPLDRHYAIGNFIRDALRGNPIRIEGDGTPRRSYLYAADLAAWLWTILLRGTNARAYNVGSEKALALAEVAKLVAELSGQQLPVTVGQKPDQLKPPELYVPSTNRAQTELGLKETIFIHEAIQRTIDFYRPFFNK